MTVTVPTVPDPVPAGSIPQQPDYPARPMVPTVRWACPFHPDVVIDYNPLDGAATEAAQAQIAAHEQSHRGAGE